MKSTKKFMVKKRVIFISLFFIMCIPALAQGTPSSRSFNDIPAVELVNGIKIGWNLGNTLDTADLHWLPINANVSQFETAWGNPVTTKAMIDTIKNAGFNAIRIPVSWSKCVNSNYVIRRDFMRRVKQVVDYAVSNEMYIILNTHHDEGIFKFVDRDMERSKKAFVKIWEQICETFKDYSEKLVFEGLNEPRTKGSPNEWNGGTAEERNNLNIYNQLFVDTVRASGGNNVMRILMIPAYAASALEQPMNDLVIPNDPVNRENKIIVSIHAYEPYNFALNENSPVNTWSRTNRNDTLPITERIDRVYSLFIQKGIPVIMGEFAALNKNNEAARAEWAEFYVSYAKSKGVKCFWWDDGGSNDPPTGGSLFVRRTNKFVFPLIIEALMKASG